MSVYENMFVLLVLIPLLPLATIKYLSGFHESSLSGDVENGQKKRALHFGEDPEHLGYYKICKIALALAENVL